MLACRMQTIVTRISGLASRLSSKQTGEATGGELFLSWVREKIVDFGVFFLPARGGA